MSDAPDVPEPALRSRIAQSWWIASELMRRHEGLRLIETHPGGGQYDCLSIVAVSGTEPQTVIDFNRAGRIHLHRQVQGLLLDREPLTWHEIMSFEGPREAVNEIERFADLGVPKARTETTASNIGFRLAAELVQRGVNDRDVWDVRNEYEATSGYTGGARGYVRKFASAERSSHEHRLTICWVNPGTATGRYFMATPSWRSSTRTVCSTASPACWTSWRCTQRHSVRGRER